LIEVMAATFLLGVFTAAAISLSAQLLSGYRLAEGYSDDLLGCRRTLRALRSDIAAASEVQPQRDGARLRAAGGDVVYRLEEGRLTRTAAGREQLLSRNLARFEVRADGALVRLSLELQPRARRNGPRPVVVAAIRRQGQP
jgi:hypothetical protein